MLKLSVIRSVRRKGSVWAWVVVIIGVTFLAIFWGIFFYLYAFIDYQIQLRYNETDLTPPPQATAVQSRYELTLNWLPLVFLFAMVLWGIVYSLTRRERTDIFG